MGSTIGFKRIYLIFNPEPSRTFLGQEPSGFIKIEVNQGKAKVLASVQNLDRKNDLSYKLFSINNDSNFSALDLGEILISGTKGELKCEVDAFKLRMAEDSNIYSIIGFNKDEEKSVAYVALTAKKNSDDSWRNKFLEYYKQLSSRKIETMTEKKESIKEKKIGKDEQNKDYIVKSKCEIEDKSDSATEEIIVDENIESMEQKADLTASKISEIEKTIDSLSQKSGLYDGTDEYASMLNNMNSFVKQGKNEYCENSESFCNPTAKMESTYPCKSCQNNSNNNNRVPTNIENLKINFDKFFEQINPFNSTRKDYKWWKVGSPVQLNNIMYECELKTPLLFNPNLMMAHFKYRHLIAGIYTDRTKRREYLVCGIPSIYEVDENPFGEMCRWAQVEGVRPKQGAFGYWLVFLDSKSGKILGNT